MLVSYDRYDTEMLFEVLQRPHPFQGATSILSDGSAPCGLLLWEEA